MAIQPSSANRSPFDKWKDGIDAAGRSPVQWNAWDSEIRRTVDEYNRHLSNTPGYHPLDWRWIKAIIWVETGAHSPAWNRQPMQIGNPGDPGLTSLLSGKEGGDRIMPPAWKGRLTVGSARSNPVDNIRAGVGYLLMRMANFRMDTVVDPNARIEKITVTASNNNLWHIARNTGTTVKNLQSLNPGITPAQLKPGMELKYQKASEQRVIFGWKTISASTVADLYNHANIYDYTRKLNYVFPRVGR
ncbi:LysM domain-containing protein [Komagataeibacter sp. FNDCF1]|uniref:LysM peptidoglycan-binding domain-containing protein n=1 Tax=Komagataeibacter sp. FNDCF1 TaxID=2878681 RepID=UPI001E2E5518|nr:LysM domain-containing protein [Komagataeibacter sp. FNDCF1]MCE2564077.1 LysM peptidoglycan-binding domain-containing protein [Komagataeibacter sp. FNDCF1]